MANYAPEPDYDLEYALLMQSAEPEDTTDDMANLQVENERLRALVEQAAQLREQLVKVGGELADKTTECVNLRGKLGAWASVVECYIRAFDCNLPAEQIVNLDALREMVAEAARKND